MSSVALKNPTVWPAIPVSELLSSFSAQYSRQLSPRGRRTLTELLMYVAEYLEDDNVVQVARRGRPGVASLAATLAALDAFEQHELYDTLGGDREKMRLADNAIRALTRHLKRSLP